MERTAVVVVVAAVIVIMNIVTFCLIGYDKRCARQGNWRVSEKMLFLATACFGGLDGILGMNVFHHKTKHWYFRVFFPAMLVVQIVILAIGAYHYS